MDGDPWSEDAARSAAEAIGKDISDAIRGDGTWPTHPLDDDTGRVLRSAWFGAAGAVTGLRILRRSGYPVADRAEALPRIHADYQMSPDFDVQPGLQMGEAGILASAVLAEPADRSLAENLERSLEATLGTSARDITFGETGTLHAAVSLFEATGEARWRDLATRLAASLWGTWTHHPDRGGRRGWFWTSDVYRVTRHYYGACHGLAGNVQALLRAAALTETIDVHEAVRRAVTTLEAGGLRDGDLLNWPVSADESGQRQLVQWCHGAPGVVSALADARTHDPALATRLDEILSGAGEFVWRAGPVAKGPGLCHGTAGNGYALLALYRRTGDRRWLHRARCFAMTAIGQSERARQRYGQRRYTLWTGDAGLAVFLHHCAVPEEAAWPGLEKF